MFMVCCLVFTRGLVRPGEWPLAPLRNNGKMHKVFYYPARWRFIFKTSAKYKTAIKIHLLKLITLET